MILLFQCSYLKIEHATGTPLARWRTRSTPLAVRHTKKNAN